ncbi:MAG: thiamine pyrophosphate-dependent enzyme [bacterium]
MANLKENLMKREPWSGLVMGNHALARSMIDCGTRVITTFPGSPTPEIAQALSLVDIADRSYHFEYATNEKVALEIAAGASMNGHLSSVFFKSVGLNVASDSLIQLPLMELIGGMVVILGDDPGINSSQNEQDNRHFARMSYIPMLEPATPTEAYHMYREAARVSRERRAPVFVRLTTHVCHAREVVDFQGITDDGPDWTPRYDARNGPYWPIAAAVFPLKRRALGKLEAFGEWAEESSHNQVFTPNGLSPIEGRRLGVIATGLPAMSVLEKLTETGQSVSLLKLGTSYPLPRRKIVDFLEGHDEVYVLEELDRVLETEIKMFAWDAAVKCRIRARTDREQLMGEMDPLRTYDLLSEAWPRAFPAREVAASSQEVVGRPPQMCPGCGHRSAFHAVKKALPKGAITVGDIGCHSLGALPPYEMGEVLLSMGHSVSTASGFAVGNDERRVVAFLGDSTLFHAALPGIVNAIVNDHDVTLVILDNATTAMTGHQARAGSGEVGEKIPLVGLLEALGVKFLRTADAYQQAKVRKMVQEANEHRGFAVVIAHHPCMLKFTREARQKRPGLALPQVTVAPGKGAEALPAMEEFGCPTFQREDGDSVSVHGDLCIGCGSCIQTVDPGVILRPNLGGKK